jgi:hypothetical protein
VADLTNVTASDWQSVTLTMPINYNTSDVIFTVTATSGSASDAVDITHKAATKAYNNTRTIQFDSGDYSVSSNPQSVTKSAYQLASSTITGTFDVVDEIYAGRIGLTSTSNSGRTFTIENLTEDMEVTAVSINYYTGGGGLFSDPYVPDYVVPSRGSMTSHTSSDYAQSNDKNNNWSGVIHSPDDLKLEFRKRGDYSSNIAIQSITVTYMRYTWSGAEYQD